MADLSSYLLSSPPRISFSLIPARRVTGIVKLVQSFIVDLLSETNFYTEKGAGLLRSLSEVQLGEDTIARSVTMTAVMAVKQRLIGMQREVPIPADERLADVKLLSVTATDNGWHISLEIINAVAQSSVVEFPGA